MAAQLDQLRSRMHHLRERVASISAGIPGRLRERVDRWLGDAAAALFHLQHGRRGPQTRDKAGVPVHPPLLAIVGGTGTGKSTLLNRLEGAEVSGTSYRRTFTGGPVAVATRPGDVPEEWLGLPHAVAGPDELPVRGRPGALMIVKRPGETGLDATLIDTPDLDGDQPAHHAEADRVFRWAEGVVFVVTPEKYQMTELLGYYRLARRYGLAAWFVMNKCDETAILDDFRELLTGRDWPDARVFAVPRDDTAYEPPPQVSLSALQRDLESIELPLGGAVDGLTRRCRDLAERLRDQVLAPLRGQRAVAEHLLSALRLLRTSAEGVDVTPLTQQLQRRMQEQSVLYLMGPERVLERITTLPAAIARLPRTAVDRLRGRRAGQPPPAGQRSVPLPWATTATPGGGGDEAQPGAALPQDGVSRQGPDFAGILTDQFVVLQSRIEDILRSNDIAAEWIDDNPQAFADARFEPTEARRIAEEELAELKTWLEQHWDQSPRDTRILQRFLKRLPGGTRAARWSEAAPYVLVAVVASVDPSGLLFVSGFYLLTWLGERLSNEVVARTRQTNRRMAERFDALAREQIDRVCHWLESRVPSAGRIDELQRLADAVSEATAR